MAEEREKIEQRFIVLETKVAYQEKLLSELHEVLLERGRQVDRLELRVEQLEKLLRDGAEETPGHERPPHY